MRRVADHGQMALFLEHRNGVDVKGVAGRCLVGADAALADHDLHIATRQDIFGAHQQLLNSPADPALEKHRFALLAQRLEQRVVLCVAGADLKHVGPLFDQADLAGVHHLGDDRHAVLVADVAEDLETVLAHALEGVRTGAGLESAAAEDVGAGFFDQAGDRVEAFEAFDGTRTGDHGEVAAADADMADGNNRIFLAEFPARQFERLEDPKNLLDAGNG